LFKKKREGQEEKNNDDIKWAIDEEEDNFDRCVIRRIFLFLKINLFNSPFSFGCLSQWHDDKFVSLLSLIAQC